MERKSYAYRKRLKGLSFEEARTRVTEALAAEGFGVLTEIDVAATLKKKLGVDFRPYVILGACNPVLAHRALEIEPEIGVLLPCNVVLQEIDGGVFLSVADPRAMFTLVGKPSLEPIVEEADERLRRMIETLG